MSVPEIPEKESSAVTRSRFRGCLLGGAVGDALGAPVEFLSTAEIKTRFGEPGIVAFSEAYGLVGAITDDTQMTLFTAEGLIRAKQLAHQRGVWDPVKLVWRAYLRWLVTQVGDASPVPWDSESEQQADGWLIGNNFLFADRDPGPTSMSTLASGQRGTPLEPVNQGGTCGAVMRAAPVGLVAEDPFTLGAEIGAITHGHPSAFLAAGALAFMIRQIVSGASIEAAVSVTIDRLKREPDGQELLSGLELAVSLSRANVPGAETIARLGAGWMASEALAIGTYAALATADFQSGIVLAVNHDGDSDSTGSICGNLLGAAFGLSAIPEHYLTQLEGRDVVQRVADDLFESYFLDDLPALERYPAS
jgi:ADP-ribosyl-[dinitrogen reductase] hydrolase